MLESNKWRFLTIVAGLILTNAIDSPVRTGQLHSLADHSQFNQRTASVQLTSGTHRTARNLYAPFNVFPKVDDISFPRSHRRSDGSLVKSFGAYRNGRNAQRRSDDGSQTVFQQSPENQTRTGRNYVYIPLQQGGSNEGLTKRNITFGQIRPPILDDQVPVEGYNGELFVNDRTERSPQSEDKIDVDDLSGRRIGFQFPNSYSLNTDFPFHPQGYREDNPIFTDTGSYERPYSEESLDGSSSGHSVEFPGLSANTKPYSGKLYRDEVTKFGDVNGPIAAAPRPQRGIFFGDGERDHRTGGPRPFAPPKIFTPDYNEFGSDYAGSRKSRYYPFKSSRSPRVVFPANDNLGTTSASSGSGAYFSDNVAFRDQNFGLNELSAIQEVRNEFGLQEIDGVSVDSENTGAQSASTFKEKVDTNTELECQGRGGTCEFFLGCWMTGGLLQGTCDGLLRGCCHRTAKSTNLKTSDYVSQTIDLTNLPNKNYGPVLNDPSCGISLAKQAAQRRIVGGDDAGFGSFPWQAYIRIGSSRCGGSLVSRRHVVTAGHCVARATPRQVHVTLGDYVINSAVEPLPAYTFGVRRIDVHPYFKFTPQADRFDVSVLTLERPVHFMPHIAPICLPEKNEDFLGKFGWAAGWGALNPGSRLRPKTLQAVDVPVIENRICERWHRQNGINVVIYPEMLCAGYRNGGKDSCQGDSGGPLMHEKNGRWYLIGVVSAGYSCASRGQPGIYHRVPFTVDWISYVVGLTTQL
ncbi:uncharacterized protein LOC129912255 [Episyrphus balteatus]|uniref:uncharacterized protein LOC129912255 n=1 Tax=Episyrphus balteatus TaxID=286459 RepID=UPI002485CF90|nr:uncharacterized protein LOC129912255 [Episyrphus balteatus]